MNISSPTFVDDCPYPDLWIRLPPSQNTVELLYFLIKRTYTVLHVIVELIYVNQADPNRKYTGGVNTHICNQYIHVIHVWIHMNEANANKNSLEMWIHIEHVNQEKAHVDHANASWKYTREVTTCGSGHYLRHFTALHCSRIHYTTLHYKNRNGCIAPTPIQVGQKNRIMLYNIARISTARHCTALHDTTRHGDE